MTYMLEWMGDGHVQMAWLYNKCCQMLECMSKIVSFHKYLMYYHDVGTNVFSMLCAIACAQFQSSSMSICEYVIYFRTGLH